MLDDLKPIRWVGSSREDLREFPPVARQRAGYQLELIQEGEDPTDWKPMESVGKGVREIRVKCKDGAFRVFYVSIGRRQFTYCMRSAKLQKRRKSAILTSAKPGSNCWTDGVTSPCRKAGAWGEPLHFDGEGVKVYQQPDSKRPVVYMNAI